MLIKNKKIPWKEEAQHSRAVSKDLVTSSEAKEFSAHHLRIEQGGEIVTHLHDQESEMHYVISGQGQALVDGEWTNVSEGDVILARPGVRHGIKNNGMATLFVLCVFSPPLV